MRILLFVVVIVVAVGGFVALRGPGVAGKDSRLQVCATIAPLADWAREVGGDDARVILLVDGYKDPHNFEPSVQDAVRVSASRALFATGLGLDPWAEKLVTNSGKGAALKFFNAGEWITPRKMTAREIEIKPGVEAVASPNNKEVSPEVRAALSKAHAHAHAGDNDPHYWHDPQRAIAVVQRLAEEFGKLDPAHKDGYAARANACVEKLKALDVKITAAAKKIPADTRVVTFHDAYEYIFERLGVKVVAVVQTSPGVEPTLKDYAEALRIMRHIKQQAIFKEPASSDRSIEMIAKDLNISRIAVLDPLDNGESPVGKNYFERMTHNIQTLEDVLGAK